jgi:antitoxin component YwqK of YwqJK toxin-antitoxin module
MKRVYPAFILILLFHLVISGILAQDNKAVSNNLKKMTVYEQKAEKGVMGNSQIESMVRYDKSGNVIEEIEYKQGKIDKHFLYKYDASNHKIEETELDPSGKKIRLTIYTYNKDLKSEKAVYDANNQLISKKTYKYETY